jgi:hypothetical protein
MAKHVVRKVSLRRLGSSCLLAGACLTATPATAAIPDAGEPAPQENAGDLAPARGLNLLAPRAAAAAPVQVAQAAGAAGATPETVGKPPEEEDFRPDMLASLAPGGVLTPGGMLVVEPSFTYSHSGVNRFTFRGTEIVETVLIGVVEAEDADRDFLEAALTLRYGVTDRLELEVRVPYVYRDDRISTNANIGGTDVQVTDSYDGSGLGDVELAAHYQLNQGGGGIPYFVANLRGKLATGEGPFDVERDSAGIETELPTGSGFYAVEPSLTVIYPTDPVVLYATAGYLWNIERDIDKRIGGSEIGRVDPGDAIRFGFGFSFAVNEDTSFSLGYSQDLIEETTTEVDGVSTDSEDLTVGNVTFGISHRLNDWLSVDVGTSFGVTDDATDLSLGIRFPMRFQLF